MKGNFVKLSERAVVAANINKPAPVSTFPSDLDDYDGVILSDGQHRIAISQYGNAYLAQYRDGDRWICRRPFYNRGEMEFSITVIDEFWPAQFLGLVRSLPSDPRSYVKGSV